MASRVSTTGTGPDVSLRAAGAAAGAPPAAAPPPAAAAPSTATVVLPRFASRALSYVAWKSAATSLDANLTAKRCICGAPSSE